MPRNPNDQERVLNILHQNQRPDTEISPASLEENLRWLAEVALPEAEASEALRQRVHELCSAQTGRRQSFLSRLLFWQRQPLSPEPGPGTLTEEGSAAAGGTSHPRRRVLVAGTVLVASILALCLLLPAEVPAQMLERTLSAMAQVQKARCTGWTESYRSPGIGAGRPPERRHVKMEYIAPHHFYRDERPEHSNTYEPTGLIIDDGQGRVIPKGAAVAQQESPLERRHIDRWVWALDFFRPEGILHRARNEKHGRVDESVGTHGRRRVNEITVQVEETQAHGTARHTWILKVDPATNRVLRSQWTLDWRQGDAGWETRVKEVLEQFQYDDSPIEPRASDRSHSPPRQ